MAWFKKNNDKQIINQLKKDNFALNESTVHLRDQLSSVMGESHNGKRNLYEVYGYPERYQFINGYTAIKREGISNRIVCGVAKSCWRNGFKIIEGTEDDQGDCILADEIQSLAKAGLFNHLERSDILNRIGQFSVLFVGIADGLNDFSKPLQRARGNAVESMYFRSFAYDGIEISKYDNDPNSPRFGLPELYQLSVKGRGANGKSIIAHFTRIIHMAENLLDSEVEGIPAIEPVYNRIMDIDKATGGASEAYFRNARGKYSFEVDPEFSTALLDNPTAKKDFDDAGKKFTNDWQDQITAHSSPADTVKTALWSISGYTGIPIRVLTGEGGGQLAGSEDRLAYNSLINDRQELICNKWVEALLQMLDFAGVLILPDNYIIEYPLAEPLTEFDKADLANKRADTLTKLTGAASSMGGDSINLESAMDYFDLDKIDVDQQEELPDVDPITGKDIDPLLELEDPKELPDIE